MIGLSHFLTVAAALFGIGVYGMLTSRNAIRILLSMELLLAASALAFAACAHSLGTFTGHIFVFFIIVLAAAEVTIGLAVITAVTRLHGHLMVDRFTSLRW